MLIETSNVDSREECHVSKQKGNNAIVYEISSTNKSRKSGWIKCYVHYRRCGSVLLEDLTAGSAFKLEIKKNLSSGAKTGSHTRHRNKFPRSDLQKCCQVSFVRQRCFHFITIFRSCNLDYQLSQILKSHRFYDENNLLFFKINLNNKNTINSTILRHWSKRH